MQTTNQTPVDRLHNPTQARDTLEQILDRLCTIETALGMPKEKEELLPCAADDPETLAHLRARAAAVVFRKWREYVDAGASISFTVFVDQFERNHAGEELGKIIRQQRVEIDNLRTMVSACRRAVTNERPGQELAKA